MAEPAPATMLAAKFSIPYAVAASLVLGRSDTAAFEPTALADPRIRDLARRVTVRTDASMSPRSLDQPTARVRIALRDGRMLEAGATPARGDAAAPLGDDEIVDKFLGPPSPLLGDRRARGAVGGGDRERR